MGRDAVTRHIERLWAVKVHFLEWLERRVGSRADAEDVLHTGLLQVIAKADTLRDEERLMPWFERILRHALVDYYRRRAAIARAERQAAAEPPETIGLEADEAVSRATCTCLIEVLETIRPAQAELVRRIEFDSESLQDIARRQGITANAAAVRLHRARRALRRALDEFCRLCPEHGHLDCGCRPRGGKAGSRAPSLPMEGCDSANVARPAGRGVPAARPRAPDGRQAWTRETT